MVSSLPQLCLSKKSGHSAVCSIVLGWKAPEKAWLYISLELRTAPSISGLRLSLPEQANGWVYQTKEEQKLQKTERISIHDNFLFHMVPSCQAPWVRFASETPLDLKEVSTYLKLMCSEASGPCGELQIKNFNENRYKTFISRLLHRQMNTIASSLPLECACIVLNPSVLRSFSTSIILLWPICWIYWIPKETWCLLDGLMADTYKTFTLIDPFPQVGWHSQQSQFALISSYCAVETIWVCNLSSRLDVHYFISGLADM